jgi:hypothetical protein
MKSSSRNKSVSDTLIAGYALTVFHPPTGTVTVLDLVLRVPTIQYGSLEIEMLGAVVDQIESDLEKGRIMEPKFGGLSFMNTRGAGVPGTSACSVEKSVSKGSSDGGGGGGGNKQRKRRRVKPNFIWIMVEEAFVKFRTQMTRIGFSDDSDGMMVMKEDTAQNKDDSKPSSNSNNDSSNDDSEANQGDMSGSGGGEKEGGEEEEPVDVTCKKDGTYIRNMMRGIEKLMEGCIPSGMGFGVSLFCPVMDTLMKMRKGATCMFMTVESMKQLRERHATEMKEGLKQKGSTGKRRLEAVQG